MLLEQVVGTDVRPVVARARLGQRNELVARLRERVVLVVVRIDGDGKVVLLLRHRSHLANVSHHPRSDDAVPGPPALFGRDLRPLATVTGRLHAEAMTNDVRFEASLPWPLHDVSRAL